MKQHYSGGEETYRSTQRFIFSNASSPEKIVDLSAGQGWGLRGRPRQQTLYCLQGSVWVTQEGDIHDYVLEAGDAFLVTLAGLVLVRALKPARIGYCDRFDTIPFKGRFNETHFH